MIEDNDDMQFLNSMRRIPPVVTSEPLYRVSLKQYHLMLENGALDDSDPCEFIDGSLLYRPQQSPRHIYVARTANKLIESLIDQSTWFVSRHGAITLECSEPEPDLLIAKGTYEDYGEHHPFASDVGLVIEVADTSLARDRGIKLRVYARGGISHYWIINLIDREIEVYEDPQSDLPEPTYASRRIVKADESISLPAIVGGASIRVADLLP